jgi:myo-inositol-1(or 4)-monophosphatase
LRAAESERSSDLDLLAHAVREAGELALGKFRATFKSWTKLGDSPVSEVDIAVNDLLRDRLSSARPDYAWLSEESVDDSARLDADTVWIVDPIDGTRAFIAGKTDWSVSVALVRHGRPIAAALFAPVEENFMLAEAGKGTALNGVRQRVSGEQGFEGARAAGPPRLIESLLKIHHRIEAVSKVHSLALRIARVATGALDIAFAGRNSHDWDIAAADLIVHEAGGTFTDFKGNPIEYNASNPQHPALVAAGPGRHGALLGIFRDQKALLG